MKGVLIWNSLLVIAFLLVMVGGWRANCISSNENKAAITRVLDDAVAVRMERNDPDARFYAERYARIKRELLEPRNCL